jgi:hypothetical protein
MYYYNIKACFAPIRRMKRHLDGKGRMFLMSTQRMNNNMDSDRPPTFRDNMTGAAMGLGIFAVVFGIAYGLEYWSDKSEHKNDRKSDTNRRPTSK